MGKLLDDGLQALAAVRDDPVTRWAVRKARPFAERALDEIQGYVEQTIGRMKAQLRDPQPRRARRAKPVRAEVIDAEIVDDQEGK